ncbi:MAG TPA: DUF3006 domain-containing protein [bacterium]|nr:DUF3006 domain-containing protein [bacterium]
MRGMIDRVEDGLAVILLEEGGRAYIPAAQLPPGAKPGTLLSVRLEVEGDADPTEAAALIEHLRHGGHL